MKGVTKVMGTMNKKMNLPQIQKIMMEFEKQNEMMGARRRASLLHPVLPSHPPLSRIPRASSLGHVPARRRPAVCLVVLSPRRSSTGRVTRAVAPGLFTWTLRSDAQG